MAETRTGLHEQLVDIFGPDRVADDAFETFLYSHDAGTPPKPSRGSRSRPDFVVLPRTAEEVSRLVRLHAQSGVALVARGGGTGWSGASVPTAGGILADFRMMNRIVVVDAPARTMAVEAGVTWWEAHERARAASLFLPVYPPSARASTIGGGLVCGVTAIGAFKYGGVRNHIADLEVVQTDGQVAKTDAKSFDPAKGSLVTRATLRLLPAPEEIRPIAFAFPSLEAAVPTLGDLAAQADTPYHLAFAEAAHVRFLREGLREVPEPADVVLIAFDGTKAEVAEGEKAADAIAAKREGSKLSSNAAKMLWENRLYAYAGRRVHGGLAAAEGLVPLARLPEAIQRMATVRDAAKLPMAFHGSLVDREMASLCPYVLFDERKPRRSAHLDSLEIFRKLVVELGGRPLAP